MPSWTPRPFWGVFGHFWEASWGHWGCLLLPGEAKVRAALAASDKLWAADAAAVRSGPFCPCQGEDSAGAVCAAVAEAASRCSWWHCSSCRRAQRPANLLCPAFTCLEMVVTRHRTQALLKEHWQLFAVRLLYPDGGHSCLNPSGLTHYNPLLIILNGCGGWQRLLRTQKEQISLLSSQRKVQATTGQ